MSAKGVILILEDDEDDRDIIESVFLELKINNERKYFSGSVDFLNYLATTREQPMIIFADINMAVQTGLEAKQTIEQNMHLKAKTIPFVFLTTSSSSADVLAAYQLNTQGFFVKPNNYKDLLTLIRDVLAYWTKSLHPNNIS